jgi:hypothetical protein
VAGLQSSVERLLTGVNGMDLPMSVFG